MTAVEAPQSLCRLGVARADITPPIGIYHRMWGAATHDRATGVHRPLTATAAAFQALDGTGEQLLLAVDHCLLWADEMDALRCRIATSTGLAAEHIVVAFSHTHGAGLMGRERVGLPGGEHIPAYLEGLGKRLTALAQEARQSARPITIVYGTGRCALAAHRDFWDEESRQFVCGYNPTGPADDTVLVARATDETGQSVAAVVNYACHPTTLAWRNTLISPDYPGAMREVVERVIGAPCLFLQGASGDLGPREGFVGDPATADRNGRQLGYAALAALEALPPPRTRFVYTGPVVSGATLGTWAHVPLSAQEIEATKRWRAWRGTVNLPYRPELPTREAVDAERTYWQVEEETARREGDEAQARDCRARVERATRALTRLAALPPGPTFPLPVTLWQIGDAVWLAVESEHYQDLQRSLRARFPGVPLVVMTLANGSRASYLPTAASYGKGIYQETIAVLAAGSLERLTEAIGDRLAEWLANGR